MSYLTFKVHAIREEVPGVKSFVLQPPGDSSFQYQAGQFLTVIIPGTMAETRRSYSFSSHPSEKFPTITLRRIPNGLGSRWLFDQIGEGDYIQTAGAAGLFTLPEEISDINTLFFMAAGSGITPAISLIKDALLRNHQKVVLFYSNHSEMETIFFHELNALSKASNGRFVIEYFFSNNYDLNRARLGRLALESYFRKHHIAGTRSLCFLCGPYEYMQNITIALLTEGVPLEDIRKEIFFNPTPEMMQLPPDRALHRVTLHYEGETFELDVQYPTSILHTARAAGIMLPYSCEAGRCGTCAANCIKGEVWMKRNEVLLDKEVARGRVLTCTGYPVGGDAEITFDD